MCMHACKPMQAYCASTSRMCWGTDLATLWTALPVLHHTSPAARLPQEFVQQMGPKLLRPGRLLRFSIRAGGLLFNADGSPAGADLAYEGPANQRRGRADVYTKVLFQWQARRQPLQLEALLAAAVAEQQQQGAGQQQGSSMADD